MSESFVLSETEWDKTKQFNPCVAFWFAVLTGLIVVVNSYHDKIMIDYEHQNSFEAAYIINLLTLVCFVILLSVRQCKKGKQAVRTANPQSVESAEEETPGEQLDLIELTRFEDGEQKSFFITALLLTISTLLHH